MKKGNGSQHTKAGIGQTYRRFWIQAAELANRLHSLSLLSLYASTSFFHVSADRCPHSQVPISRKKSKYPWDQVLLSRNDKCYSRDVRGRENISMQVMAILRSRIPKFLETFYCLNTLLCKSFGYEPLFPFPCNVLYMDSFTQNTTIR